MARSNATSVAIGLVVWVVAGCGGPNTEVSPSAVATPLHSASPAHSTGATPTSATTPGLSRGPSSASPSPSATSGSSVNVDGSVLVRTPARFGFPNAGQDAVWGVLEYPGAGRQIVRLDPESYELEAVVSDLPILPNPVEPVVANGSIWLLSWDTSSATEYDAETGEVTGREIKVGKHPVEPVLAYGDIWTINHHDDSITRLDVTNAEAYPAISLPGSLPLTITIVDEDLLLVNGPDGTPTTWMVDPKRMKVVGTFESTGCLRGFGWLGAGIDGRVWRKSCDRDEVVIIDPRSGQVLDSFEAPVAPYPPLSVDRKMWMPLASVASPERAGLVAVDPDSHAVAATYQLPADFAVDWWFTAFDSWWAWGSEGLLRVPADTLRGALH